MNIEDNIAMAKRSVVDTIWKQANLEGIGITFPDTYAVYEGMSVAGIEVSGIITINNLKHAWQFLFDTLDAPTDAMYARQMNGIVGMGLYPRAGEIRDYDVYMGGTTWVPDIPDYDDAKAALEQLRAIKDPTDRGLDMFCYLCRSQLFADGNKRTATLLANKELISAGAGMLAVPVDRISEFSERLIRFYETNEPDELKAFLEGTSLVNDETLRKRRVAQRANDRQTERRGQLFAADSKAQEALDIANGIAQRKHAPASATPETIHVFENPEISC